MEKLYQVWDTKTEQQVVRKHSDWSRESRKFGLRTNADRYKQSIFDLEQATGITAKDVNTYGNGSPALVIKKIYRADKNGNKWPAEWVDSQ